MNFLLFAAIGQELVKILLIVVAIFLILLVLVQRGRGGGLAGALGGMGGSSAFGAKAGDVFTKVTIFASFFWIVLCIAAVNLGPSTESRINTGGRAGIAPPVNSGPGLSAPAEEASESSEESDDGPVDEALFEGDSDAGSDSSSDTDADSSEAE